MAHDVRGGGAIEAGASSSALHDAIVTAHDGLPLMARWWARERPKGCLVIAHGLGEHGGCYAHVAERLGPALDLDILAFDFRGHGRSPGRRGSLRRFAELHDDLIGALDWARGQFPAGPRFLLGHSYGGLVALGTMLEDGAGDLAGLILSNPALKVAARVPRHKLVAGMLLRRYAPAFTLATGMDDAGMTRDPEMRALRASDPLRHSRICASIFFGMPESAARIAAAAQGLRLPTLLILGESDPVIDPAGTLAVFEGLGSPDKTLLSYPGVLHEPFWDLDRVRVLDDLAAWLAPRLPA